MYPLRHVSCEWKSLEFNVLLFESSQSGFCCPCFPRICTRTEADDVSIILASALLNVTICFFKYSV